MSNIEDLWGELPKVEKIKTPLMILKEQAEILSKKTNNLIEGFVDIIAPIPNSMRFRLKIKATALGGYTANIVEVRHDIRMYPIEVLNSQTGMSGSLQNESEYLEALTKIFQSEEIRNLISAVLAQIISSEKS